MSGTVVLLDVAKKAGVSISTASLAVRGQKRVSPQTREKVRKAARELGFFVNASARSLASGRSDNIGVAIHDLRYLSSPYFGGVISGIAQVSDRMNLGLMFARSGGTLAEQKEYFRITMEGRVDGMVIVDQDLPKSRLREYAKLNVPAVLVDRLFPGNNFCVALVDYREAVYEATSHLYSLGHRRIAVITPNVKMYEYTEKLAGYRQFLLDEGLGFDSDLVKSGDESVVGEERLKAIIQELTSMKEPPTAYLCFQDIRTFPLHEALRMQNLRVPEVVSRVGFESCKVEDSGLFRIGVIKVPEEDRGMRACEWRVGLLNNNVSTRKVILKATFEPRATCGFPSGQRY